MFPYEIWNKTFTKKSLKEIFESKVKKSNTIGTDMVSTTKFSENLDDNIEIILRKVNNEKYHFTRYNKLLFSKGEGKPPRVIYLPTVRDKITLCAINDILIYIYNNACKTQLPQIVIKELIEEIPHYDSFIKLDVKTFYRSINHKLLLKKLNQKIKKKQLLSLIEKSINNGVSDGRGIPEGLTISNSLANIFMMSIDFKYQQMTNLKYVRYVDDILILCNSKDKSSINEEIKKDLQDMDLELNEKVDDGLISKGFTYLGYKMNNKLITVRQSSVLTLERRLEYIIKHSNKDNCKISEWKLNLRIAGFINNDRKYGWIFYYSQLNDLKLLFHLDDLVQKLLKRYGVENYIHPKRYVRTYFEITKALSTTNYIYNFDTYSIERKRQILKELNFDVDNQSADAIEYLFNRLIGKLIKNIEHDIQHLS